MDYIRKYDSPLDGITMASDGEALTGLWFEGQHFYASTLGECVTGDLPVFRETGRWLDVYFSGRDPGFTPPLSLRGTPFRQSVWAELLNIPFGQTATYGEIAARIGALSRTSARAVGGAVGHNPVSLIVPCHRVVGSGGALTGYAGGLDLKRRLLQLETGEMIL